MNLNKISKKEIKGISANITFNFVSTILQKNKILLENYYYFQPQRE